MTVRILIADDHPVFRSGLRSLLESAGFEVVGEASDGDEAVVFALETRPDVVLMDLHMAGGGGAAAAERIRRAWPDARVLVLTMFADDAAVSSALRAGAAGYILKDAEQEALLRSITAVAAGDAVFGAPIAPRLLAHLASGERHERLAFPDLTPRELEVLDLLAEGASNTSIAWRLGVSIKTVRNHVSNVLVKTHAADRSELIVRARESGLGQRSVPRDDFPT